MRRWTDCGKWADDWFMQLDWQVKLVAAFLYDTCDHAGVWPVSKAHAEIMTGFTRAGVKLDWDEVFKQLSAPTVLGERPRVVAFANQRKWWLTRFIPYQNPTDSGGFYLNPLNGFHASIIKSLRKHGPELEALFAEYYPKALTPRPAKSPAKPLPSFEDCWALPAAKDLPEDVVRHFWSHWQSKGWRRNRERVSDLNALMAEWVLNGKRMEQIADTARGLTVAEKQQRLAEIAAEDAQLKLQIVVPRPAGQDWDSITPEALARRRQLWAEKAALEKLG